MQRVRDNFIDGMQYYVPAMQGGADLGGQPMHGRFTFGKPLVALATAILSAQSIAAAVNTRTFAATYTVAAMGPYGRNVTVVASGAATSNVTVIGRDYLGQAMRESFTLNGTTPVVGVKAFKYIDNITAGITAATTINVGYGARFGVPYKVMVVEREYADNVNAAAGTLTVPNLTDPQTATTTDPRGLYTPTTTPNGLIEIEVEVLYSAFVNAAGNGGLHGIKHFNT